MFKTVRKIGLFSLISKSNTSFFTFSKPYLGRAQSPTRSATSVPKAVVSQGEFLGVERNARNGRKSNQ